MFKHRILYLGILIFVFLLKLPHVIHGPLTSQKRIAKTATLFKQVFFKTLPHLSLAGQTGSPTPISLHWLSKYCFVKLIVLEIKVLKMAQSVFPFSVKSTNGSLIVAAAY